MKPARIVEYLIVSVVIMFAGTGIFAIGLRKTYEANKQPMASEIVGEDPQK